MFVNAIYKMIGTTGCIDRITRLGFTLGISIMLKQLEIVIL